MAKKCYECRRENDFDSEDDYLCKECKALGVRMTPVVCHGLSDGPGNNFICFDRPNPAKEMEHTFRVMEQNGKLDDPQKKAKAKALLKSMKNSNFKQVDYGKGDKLND